jgi:hypothetical protein
MTRSTLTLIATRTAALTLTTACGGFPDNQVHPGPGKSRMRSDADAKHA